MDRYTSIKRLLKKGTFLLFLSYTTMSAQNEEYFTITLEMLTDLNSTSKKTQVEEIPVEETPTFFTASAEVELTPKGDVFEEIPSYFRHHKMLDENYSGYVIELLQSENKLKRNFPLFERFGNIHVQQLENGTYSYCIIANFKKSNSLKIFVNEVIIPHAPEAKAWKYKRGKRKKM